MARISYEPAPSTAPVIAPSPAPAKKTKRPLRQRFKRGCCLLILLIIIFSGLVGAAAVAKTGIWEIPVFTAVFYRLPQPIRLIKIGDLAEYKTEGAVIKAIGSDRVRLEITEKDLTYFLRRNLTGKTDSPLSENLQAVIAGGQVEIYGFLLRPVRANLTVKIKPEISANQLNYALTELKIGDLGLPVSLSKMIFDRVFGSKIAELNRFIAENFTVYRLEFADGKAAAEIAVSPQRLNEYLKIIELTR